MSEVEKLMQNAGINKVCNTCELRGFKRLCPSKELCVRTNPQFTAEKQIELIKFISGWNMFLKNNAGQFYIATGDNAISYYAENLEDAICLCINSKWQLMNEEEKQQVKGILE